MIPPPPLHVVPWPPTPPQNADRLTSLSRRQQALEQQFLKQAELVEDARHRDGLSGQVGLLPLWRWHGSGTGRAEVTRVALPSFVAPCWPFLHRTARLFREGMSAWGGR